MLVIGHRGAAGHEPENTIRSFRAAMALGVDLVETDIQLTKDGQLVVFHDKLLDRVTTGTGYLADHDFDELAAAVSVDGEPIPLLSDVCAVLRGTSVKLMAEILDPNIAGLVVETLDRSLGPDGYIVASFHHDALREASDARAGVDTLALIEGAPVDPVRMLTECGARYAGLGFESIQEKQVRALQDADIRVFVWTVNDLREIDRAYALGVDGIISDFPERVRTRSR